MVFECSVLFSWTSPILNKGQKEALKIEDIYASIEAEKAENVHQIFHREWVRLGEDATVKDAYQPLIKPLKGRVAFLRWLNTTVQFGWPIFFNLCT